MKRTLFALLIATYAAGPAALMAQRNATDIESTVQDVDATRDKGWKVWATIPIFHQILAFSFPKGFVPSSEVNTPPSYLQESVPLGETVDKWTQMITVTGAENAAANPTVTPDSPVEFIGSGYKRACPTTFSVVHLPSDSVANFSGRIVFLGCGTVGAAGPEHSEAMLLITLKGDLDYYTIQWAERGPISSIPLTYAEKKWSDRLQQLLPIRVCARVPGEAAPYPSCISPKTE